MLKLTPATSAWLALLPARGEDPAVRIEVSPITIKAVRAARRALAAALGIDAEDLEEAGDALSRELLRRGILAWEGIGNANGEPIAPTDLFPVLDADGEPVLDADGKPVMQKGVELFLADPMLFELADQLYVLPWAQASAEKNGFAGSLSGTSKAATPAPDTVTSPAPSAPTDAASAAASAPTSRTSSRPKKRSSRGKSSRPAARS